MSSMKIIDKSIIKLLPRNHPLYHKYHCFVVKQFLSQQQCKNFLMQYVYNEQGKTKLENAIYNYPTYYRNNERIVVDSLKLANSLYSKIFPYIPEQISCVQDNKHLQQPWIAKSLNPRMRFCRYGPNQYFNRHLDGVHYRSQYQQSKLTFMVYLNNYGIDFLGGRTLFFQQYSSSEVLAEYFPSKGDLIIFDHNIWHEGQTVLTGQKFIMRSDIIYQRQSQQNNHNQASSTYFNHSGYIWSLLKWSRQLLISGGRDKSIKIWLTNKQKLQCIQEITHAHNNSIIDLIKLNESTMISCSRDKSIKLWQLKKLHELQNQKFVQIKQIKFNENQMPLSLLKLNDSYFACGFTDGKIRIFSSPQYQIKTILQAHDNWIWKLQKINQNTIISCSEDGSLRIWDLSLGKQVSRYDHHCSIQCVLYIDQVKAIIAGDLSGNILKFQLTNSCPSGYNLLLSTTKNAHKSSVRSLHKIPKRHLSLNNNIIKNCSKYSHGLLISASQDCRVKVWNLQQMRVIHQYRHQNFVQDICSDQFDNFCDNQPKIYSCSYDGIILFKPFNQIVDSINDL